MDVPGDLQTMTDIRDLMDVFVITNGRSSFPFVLDLLQRQQGVRSNSIQVVQDMTWLDACMACLEYSARPYYLRLDDDMLLNPWALAFMVDCLIPQASSNTAAVMAQLWEPWVPRNCGAVKIYVREQTKQLGFSVDARGKVDKIFKVGARERGFAMPKDASTVAIHAACPAEDNQRYSELREETRTPEFRVRAQEIKKLDKVCRKHPLAKQAGWANRSLFKHNKKEKTSFFRYAEEYYA